MENRAKTHAVPSAPLALPAGVPNWITFELVQRTIRVFQPYYSERLTVEEVIGMIQRAARLLGTLMRGASP